MCKYVISLFFVAAVFGPILAQEQPPQPGHASPKPARRGVLLLAHGGRLQQWNEEVRHIADRVDLTVPTEIAFGMASRSSMQSAIDRLADREVTEIVAIPLFVSSHSSVIDCTAYLLGLRSDAPDDLKMFASMNHGAGHRANVAHENSSGPDVAATPVRSSVPIRMTPALDHHPTVAGILADRAASISTNPAREVIVLVAHGPVEDDENKQWLNDMKSLASQIREKHPYAGIECLTLRDDADEPVRNEATRQLRDTVKRINDSHQTALVVPLLLSFGGIEDGLRKRLSELDYKMPNQGLLPDERIVSWVLESAPR